MPDSRLRIRSIRPKDGSAEVRVLRPPTSLAERMSTCGARMVGCLGDEPVVGYCLVAWHADGTAHVMKRSSNGNPIPLVLLPDFLRNLLLADIAGDWAVDEIKKLRGF